jgi:hypothetical protein
MLVEILVPLVMDLKLAFKFKAVLFSSWYWFICITYIIPNPTIALVIPLTVPVNVGLAKFLSLMQFVVVDTGLFASVYYLHYPNQHYFCYSTYCTSKCWWAKFAFKFNAANCALAGLLASLVLSTFVKLISTLSNTTTQLYH